MTIFYSKGSFQPRDQIHVSCMRRWVLYHCSTWEAQSCVILTQLEIPTLKFALGEGWDTFNTSLVIVYDVQTSFLNPVNYS